MEIEIAEPGRMTQTGSSLLKLIQNNNMPVLDLFVRESIQNSLDARKHDSKYVQVEYITGNFLKSKLCLELDKISKSLNDRYINDNQQFLAIRDFNTVGLTGDMDYKKVKNNQYGNLLKLIYEICKPQQAEGAGGSWGLGKTVYFRMGIGLVIYYSRIQEEDGSFSSRLAASLVEDETKSCAIIPEYKGMTKRGIAWWGKCVEENTTQPITDEEYINSFINIFGISAYQGNETGTTIIIPFIEPDLLLKHNQVEYLEGSIVPTWCDNLEEYLSVSIQRWYAPRLNNKYYRDGAFLRMKVNNVGISYDSMEPTFKVIQALYNRANYVVEEDILSQIEENTKVKDISINRYLHDKKVGVVACAKVTRELLQMNPPYNKLEPYMYFNSEKRDEDVNKPTICYTRKPGMIVAYENVGAWVSNIQPTNSNEYILGIFVLNSWNKVKENYWVGTLEEYVRKSEMADHTSWSDWSDINFNPRIVSKIQKAVNKTISKEYSIPSDNPQPKRNSGLGKLFGELLLPPEGFGKNPSSPEGPQGSSRPSIPRKKRGFQVEINCIKYLSDSIIIPIKLELTKKDNIISSFEMTIETESKNIKIGEWENKMNMPAPFQIKDCKIEVEQLNGVVVGESTYISEDCDTIDLCNILFEKRYTKNGTCYGMRIEPKNECSMKLKMTLTVSLFRRDIKPSFIFEREEENNG